jgi:hypothetical protein
VWDCTLNVAPTNCTNGALYMKLRSARESCQLNAFLATSQKKLAAANNLTDPAAAGIADACKKSIKCETDTVTQWLSADGKNTSCVGFFSSDYIRTSFAWASACDQAKICKDYATATTTATSAPPSSSTAPASLRGAALAAVCALAAALALLA